MVSKRIQQGCELISRLEYFDKQSNVSGPSGFEGNYHLINCHIAFAKLDLSFLDENMPLRELGMRVNHINELLNTAYNPALQLLPENARDLSMPAPWSS